MKGSEATADATGETIGDMFDIPFYGIEDQIAESMTLGSASYETGTTENTSQSDESWDPFWEL